MGRWLGWLAIGVLGIAVLSLLAAYAPPQIRKLVLFPAAFGVLAGWGLGRLGTEFQLPQRRVALAAGVLVVAGLVNCGVATYRQLAAESRRAVQLDPQRLLGLRLLEEQAQHDAAWAQRLLEERLRSQPTFSDFLAGRVAGLGWWPDPRPALFWIGELLLAGLAGAWTAARTLRRSTEHAPPDATPSPSPSE